MGLLGLSKSAQRDDEYYREQWRAYYAVRRRLLARMFWLAGGLGAIALLFMAIPGPVVEQHPLLADMVTVPIVILLLALPALWFIFVWKTGGWICPQCGEPFFISTFVRNPFGRKCRHCKLPRPKESDINEFHFQDERSG